MSNSLQIVESEDVQPMRMITPAGTIEEAIKEFKTYQQLKQRIGTSEDFQMISGKVHPKKSFVRKIQRFFNVSCEILQDEALRNPDGEIEAWLVKVRAIHLGTGAFQDADGSCSFDEKRRKNQPATLHNVRAHAVTRAKNRAILDLVGFGEVTAEEISGDPSSYEVMETGYVRYLITDKQRRALFSISRKKGLSDDEIRVLVCERTDKESTKALERKEASQLIDYVKNTPLEKIRNSLVPQNQTDVEVIEDMDFEELDEVVMSE